MPAGSADIKVRWRNKPIDLRSPSPFGLTAAGAADYRGAIVDPTELESARFSNVDFSQCDLRHSRFTKCHFERCVFKRADLALTVVTDCDFIDCDFSRADFRQALLGVWGTRFRACVFDGVRTAGCSPVNPEFETCNFRGEDWRNVRFWAAGFWSCSFSGELTGAEFNGRGLFSTYKKMLNPKYRSGLHDISFEYAKLRLVGCKDGCELENVRMPLDGSSIICAAADLVALEHSDYNPELLSALKEYFSILHLNPNDQPKQIISRSDLDNLCAPQLADELYDLMRTKTAITA